MDTRTRLLTAQDIKGMKGEHKVHFLNPGAIRINKSLGDAVGLQDMGIHLIEVKPGDDSTEYHRHYYEEEAVYVLSGRGTLTVDGDCYPIAAGDFAGFPRATVAHAIRNDGAEILVCLVMGQRLAQDIVDYPHQHKRLYRHNGTWDLVDVADIHVVRDTQRK